MGVVMKVDEWRRARELAEVVLLKWRKRGER
jgi:hypothetical protein